MLAREYIRAGIPHMVPVGLSLTNPQSSISDEFFEYAKLKHVNFIRGVVKEIAGDQIEILELGGQLNRIESDTVVLACGFKSPSYEFLSAFPQPGAPKIST